MIQVQLFHWKCWWILQKCNNVWADESSSAHADNGKKDILIHEKGPTNELDDTTVTATAKYYINFAKQYNKFCLRLH